MLGDMRPRPVYTEAEKIKLRQTQLDELNENRIGCSEISNMDRVIYLLEENAWAINDVMQDKDVNGHYSPSLQAAFDDTMDILDYLKKLRNSN